MQAIVDWVKEQPGSVLGIVFVLIGLHFFISLIRRGFQIAAGKSVTVRARVVEKRDGEHISAPIGELIFEAGGLVLRLRAGQDIYNSLSVGQKGRLTYQGKDVTRFR